MCRLLKVSRAGYYAWRDRPVSAQACRRAALTAQIHRVHAASRGLYGSPRVQQELAAGAVKVCRNTVAKLMRQEQLRSRIYRKFRPRTTDSSHGLPVAANHLQRQFGQALPNRAWCMDITYIQTGEGMLYLAAVLDLCSRRIVGWSMAEHLRSELCTAALQMALGRRETAPGLLCHSDRGVQYASEAYQRLLQQKSLTCSMSGRGECYDNAVMESFWGTLKREEVYQQRYATRAQAKQAIFEYIEVFYNRQRRHSSLGYVSPEVFEAGLN
jgi:transposase InsO family protein